LFCAKNTDCTVNWMWALNPGCWSMTPSEWAQLGSIMAPPAPPVPTQDQLSAVASGAMTPDQLTQQLSNQQMTAAQQAAASSVQYDTSVIAQAANPMGPGGCEASIIPFICDSTLYVGLGIGALVLLLLWDNR
jgi:hypothetical protein